MKKAIIFLILIMSVIACGQLTSEQVADVNDYVSRLDPNCWVLAMSKSKDHQRTRAELEAFAAFEQAVDANQVTMIIDSNEVNATMIKVKHITRLDRPWTVPIIRDVLLGKRCPVDLHLYNQEVIINEEN